jgi:hypothetical protein
VSKRAILLIQFFGEKMMTLTEAIALQPAWVGIWLNVLLGGAFVLPLTLFIWRRTRIVAAVILAANVFGALGVEWMYSQMGYVKLLGLPHILFWTPLAIYLVTKITEAGMPVWPRRIMMLVLATIVISLAFDYADAIRYFLGNTTPSVMPAE